MLRPIIEAAIIFAASFALVAAAHAQAPPPDIFPPIQAGTYAIGVLAPADLDMARVCLEEMELSPPLELVCAPAGPNETVNFTVTVTPAGTDIEIRGFAYDQAGNKSPPSPNAARIDLTAPAPPSIVLRLKGPLDDALDLEPSGWSV